MDKCRNRFLLRVSHKKPPEPFLHRYDTNVEMLFSHWDSHEGDVEIYKSSLNGNHYPYVANPVENQNLNVNFTPFTIDLKNVFQDTETEDDDILFSASGYEGISVSISN